MTVAEVHVGDWGTELRLTLKDGSTVVNLTDAVWIRYRISDPDEVVMIRDAVIRNPPGTDGKIKYVFVDGELDQEGTWEYQVKVLFPSGFWQSDILNFVVYENLGGGPSVSPSASISPSASPSPSV